MNYEELSIYLKITSDFKLAKWCFRSKQFKIIESIANHSLGYCHFRLKSKKLLYHRVMYCLYWKENLKRTDVIDHIDGNRLNNHPINLKKVTSRENSLNTYKTRTGNLPGCHYNSASKNFTTQISTNNGKMKWHIGNFLTEKEAHKAYMVALKYIHELEKSPNKADLKKFRLRIQKELYFDEGIIYPPN